MRRRWSGTAVVAALVVGSATSAQGAQPPGPQNFSPGAPGIGDRYYPLDGNGGYDVERYALDLRYDPASDELSGTATITARATQDLTSFDLDLKGVRTSALTVDGAPARHRQLGGELVVAPAAPIAVGAVFTTVVTYSGVPRTVDDQLGISGFIHTDDGAVVAGQPEGAATWFPVNDHPRDAAAYEVSVAVPEGLEAVSNGSFAGSSTADGWTTWNWSAPDPMASYLLTLAVGEFDITTREVDGRTYLDAVDPDADRLQLGDDPSAPTAGAVARASLARQPEIVDFLSSQFGEYPFTDVGGIVDDDPSLGFALETQTRPVYSPAFFTDAAGGDSVVVHELAHQWFGDDVRLASWQHIWLNEGFATYAEWLWAEREGRATVQQIADAYAGIPAEDPFWSLRIGDPGPDHLFDAPVYVRGALTLHALRLQVGESAFWGILRRWADERSGEAVTTPEFTALAEEVSGQDLDGFFRTWLDTPARPGAPSQGA